MSARAAVAALAIAILFALTAVLTPSAQAQTYTVIHNFTGGGDGAGPWAGLTMDQAGNFYGTASGYTNNTNGVVFRLSKKGSAWMLNPLYSFAGGNDGAGPWARVVFGPDGYLYGTTTYGGGGSCTGWGGSGCGTVFQLKPYPAACKTAVCGWQETVLYRFNGGSDGAFPEYGDLVFDRAGNIYGTTGAGGYQGGICSNHGGSPGCGVVFELTPSNGGWTEKVLYTFTAGSDGANPISGLTFDNVGNLYGTTSSAGGSGCGGFGCGTVFQLTPSGSGWILNVLYTFQGENDGGGPLAGLMFDQAGNIYGTAAGGGAGNGGTAFELSPSKGMAPWTYTLLYGFSGDGSVGPVGTLVMDAAGNLYGTTYADSPDEYGTVFELTPSNGGWTYTSLHNFSPGNNGGGPVGNVTFDASGNLYGTANGGASGNCEGWGCGVVWEITP